LPPIPGESGYSDFLLPFKKLIVWFYEFGMFLDDNSMERKRYGTFGTFFREV